VGSKNGLKVWHALWMNLGSPMTSFDAETDLKPIIIIIIDGPSSRIESVALCRINFDAWTVIARVIFSCQGYF
jgi:hypothetical protein